MASLSQCFLCILNPAKRESGAVVVPYVPSAAFLTLRKTQSLSYAFRSFLTHLFKKKKLTPKYTATPPAAVSNFIKAHLIPFSLLARRFSTQQVLSSVHPYLLFPLDTPLKRVTEERKMNHFRLEIAAIQNIFLCVRACVCIRLLKVVGMLQILVTD